MEKFLIQDGSQVRGLFIHVVLELPVSPCGATGESLLRGRVRYWLPMDVSYCSLRGIKSFDTGNGKARMSRLSLRWANCHRHKAPLRR